MRRYISILCLILFCLTTVPSASADEPQKKKQYVVVPSENLLLVIAYQPDCPLQFESVKMLASADGGGGPTFQLRNRGTKPLRSVNYAWWTSAGSGSTGSWPVRLTREVVNPGQLVPLADDSETEIVPLTKELRDKLNLQGPMKAVVVFMVVNVTFADGTTYSDEHTFQALRAYFNNLAGLDDKASKVKRN
jgi:hypothetical protein